MRLIIVSNRLPITIFTKNNKLELRQSVGGLTTGLSAFLNHLRKSNKYLDSVWVGWPGRDLAQETEIHETLEALSYFPVEVSDELMKPFYAGFCNNTIWPLFHGMISYADFNESEWIAYQKVNQIYFETISQTIQEDDVIWIHDYHFLLLPKLLREKFPQNKIGFFLHIPFPHFEAIQFLPRQCRKDIIEGLLGADLIGFHTQEYSQYFIKSVLKILGLSQRLGNITVGHRDVHVESYPMGIDVGYIQSKLDTEEVSQSTQQFALLKPDTKLLISVDRLDYTKGLENRLKGYLRFLEKNTEWHGKVKLLLIVSPSREDIAHYKEIKHSIDHLVGQINGKFGRFDWTPIIYQYRSYRYDELIALYALSDIAIVTPIRDGMNLVAKEFVAAKRNQKGVLILSETAGAAKELLDAVLINPHSIDEIADALLQAVQMDETQQMTRLSTMQQILRKNDVKRWGENFLHDLIDIENHHPQPIQMSFTETIAVVQKYQAAKQCLFIIDYDGTLVPFASQPSQAQPGFNVLKLLKQLTQHKKNHIAIVSGRDKNTLDQWLGHLDVDLVAEHSAWIKTKGEWKLEIETTQVWKTNITKLLQDFVIRLPESHIEIKDYSVVFHYRNCDPEKSQIIVKQLFDYLLTITAQGHIMVMPGNAILEIKDARITKSLATHFLQAQANYDFILAIGDDTTDEDIFRALPPHAISVKVGIESSAALFNVPQQKHVIELLQLFTERTSSDKPVTQADEVIQEFK